MNRRLVMSALCALNCVLAGCGPQPAANTANTTDSTAGAAGAVLSVTLVAPTQAIWPQRLQADGALTAWQEAVVGAETGGLRIAELNADVGTPVRRGQLLARLADDSLQADLRKQDALVAQAEAALAQAQADAQRARAVADSGALSPQKIQEYGITEQSKRAALASAMADRDSTQLKLQQTRIVAVDDGVVSSRTAMLGNVAASGAELFRLLRQGRIEWRAELDAQQLAQVRTGQPAQLVLPGGRAVSGKVALVEPLLNSSTGRALVHVSLPAGSGAQAGMFASGRIDVGEQRATTLPQSAVVLRDGRSYVFTVGADQRVQRHVVTLGRREGDRVEVLQGLPANLPANPSARAQIVASGGAFLSDGARVTIATGAQP